MACHPFNFVRVLQLSGVARALLGVLLLQSLGEPRTVQDTSQLFLRDQLGWNSSHIGLFTGISGMTVIGAGCLVKQSIALLGYIGHTSMSNLSSAAQAFVRGTLTNTAGQYLGLFVGLPGGRKRDAVESFLTDYCLNKSAMGRGEIIAALSNFKSIAAIIGPIVLGSSYTWGARRGVVGLPFYQIGCCYLMAELLFRMAHKRIGIDSSTTMLC